MTKIDMITSMFEEIKTKLDVINKQLDNNVGSSENKGSIKELSGISIQDLSIIMADIVDFSVQYAIGKIQDENSKLINSTKEQLQNVDNNIKQTLPHLGKRKRLTFRIISLQLTLAISIILNLNLLNKNQQLNDSDLQLQYLKVANKIDRNLLNHLDTIFYIYRNEEAIQLIKKTIETNH